MRAHTTSRLAALTALAALAALVVICALAGCSLLNQPDRDRLIDGGPDGAVPDGTVSDGNMFDGGIEACIASNEECGNGIDDNCNGLVDCADFECAQQPECCGAGDSTAEQWASFSAWDFVPVTATPPQTMGSSGTFRIVNWSGTPSPSGVISRLCEPLAAGRKLSVIMRRDADCPTCFARLALTPAANARPTELILDDLSVTLFGDGRVTTSQNRRTRAETEAFVTVLQEVEITIEIVPGADALGRASLLATVTARNRTTEAEQVLEDNFAFVSQSVLLTGPGEECAAVGGLNLAFQGEGAGVSVGTFTRTAIDCVNPSQFYPNVETCTTAAPYPYLTVSGADGTVDLQMEAWAGGGISAPSMVGEPGMPNTWHLFVDGTTADRTLEDVTYLGFGIGYTNASTTNWCDGWADAEAPQIRSCAASCLGIQGSGCTCTESSAREPSALRKAPGFVVAYAVQRDPHTDVYEIAVDSVVTTTTGTARAATITRMAHASMCESLRDPMIVRAGTADEDGYWVFFTCEQGAHAHIRAIALGQFFDVVGTSMMIVEPAPGTYSAGAIYAPEVLVEYDPSDDDRHVYRLWALARDVTQSRVSVALFQGQLEAGQAAAGELPTFVPFGANPIITEDHAIFRGCPDCDLLGLSVARDPGSTSSLRFLVARRVNGGTAADYQLVPYEQFWRSPF